MSTPGAEVFVCPTCGTVHRGVIDVAERYCRHCHAFTGSCPLVDADDVPVLTEAGGREGYEFRVARPAPSPR